MKSINNGIKSYQFQSLLTMLPSASDVLCVLCWFTNAHMLRGNPHPAAWGPPPCPLLCFILHSFIHHYFMSVTLFVFLLLYLFLSEPSPLLSFHELYYLELFRSLDWCYPDLLIVTFSACASGPRWTRAPAEPEPLSRIAFVCCGEQSFFFFFPLLADSWLSVHQHSFGLACADGWLTDPSWEQMLCLSPTVACQRLSHKILSKCWASPFPSHCSTLCLPATSWQQGFFFSPPYPHSIKYCLRLIKAGQKKKKEKRSESACCLSFLGTLMHCQRRKKRRSEREVVGADGL